MKYYFYRQVVKSSTRPINLFDYTEVRFTLSVDAKRASKNSNKTGTGIQSKKGVKKKVVARNSAVICLITMWCFSKRLLVKQQFNRRFFILGAMQLFILCVFML